MEKEKSKKHKAKVSIGDFWTGGVLRTNVGWYQEESYD
jgi:hypothetical protein